MGGSDQWGNITTGNELIRRKDGGEAYALTWPLIAKSDGSKFGKTETGNIWLDPKYTSAYKFYQFWLNSSDEDAERYIKIFTLLKNDTIDNLINQHRRASHLRLLQKELAKEITIMVHSEEEYKKAVEASKILFGKGTTESLKSLDEDTFLSIFEGVPLYEINAGVFKEKINLAELLVEKSNVFSSKGELRRIIKGGGLSLNKEKINDPEFIVSDKNLLNNKYLLIQKGKKDHYILRSL
jgi:tyrosyl-tRNA synthetase